MLTIKSCIHVFVIGVIAITAASLLNRTKLEPVQPGDAVVVTGSSSGIGKHAALSLAKEGYTVFACVRKTTDGDALLESAKKYEIDAEKIKILILDVTNSKHIAKGVEVVSKYVGDRGLKGLFNNAGINVKTGPGVKSTSVEFSPMEGYRQVFDVNYFGLVEMTKAFLELLRKGQGRIVMNTSVAGFIAGPFLSAYSSSKHAVEGFSDSLRRELLPHGVKVSILECGFIATPIIDGGIPDGVHPYDETERNYWKRFWKDSATALSPKVSSEAVIHAMRATKPKVRYVVGKQAALLGLFRFIPGGWVDRLVTEGNKKVGEIGDEELKELVKNVHMEFEL
mmetsp:Transcript_34577/g.45845  ORF Transcript_34577/g.45845 Transcript_34577/m.45845 type:complete len:338 (-) Transcript_34577:42-1055(-)